MGASVGWWGAGLGLMRVGWGCIDVILGLILDSCWGWCGVGLGLILGICWGCG